MPFETHFIATSLATIQMNMKKLIKLLFCVLLLSCNKQGNKASLTIDKFEEKLGTQEVEYLNEIILDFDNYLDKNYPNQEFKFKSYISDINEQNIENYWEIDSNKLIVFKDSRLFRKYEKSFPDSVWFNGQVFLIKYANSELEDELVPMQSQLGRIDSTISALENAANWSLKEESHFYLALENVQKSDSLISGYLDAKEAAGSLSIPILASGLSYSLNEDNKYFAKRIFVIEMYEE